MSYSCRPASRCSRVLFTDPKCVPPLGATLGIRGALKFFCQCGPGQHTPCRRFPCLGQKSTVHRLPSLPYHLQYARRHSECHLSLCIILIAPPQSSMGAISTLQRKKPGSKVLAQAAELRVQCTAEDLDGGSDPKMLSCCALVRNRPRRAESSRNRAHPEPLGASHCHQGSNAVWKNQRLRAQ